MRVRGNSEGTRPQAPRPPSDLHGVGEQLCQMRVELGAMIGCMGDLCELATETVREAQAQRAKLAELIAVTREAIQAQNEMVAALVAELRGNSEATDRNTRSV